MRHWLQRCRAILLYARALLYYAAVKRRRDAHVLATIARSEYFSVEYYLDRYEDVANAGIDSIVHYLDHGAAEGRNPSRLFDTRYYVDANRAALANGMNPLVHYLRNGIKSNQLPMMRISFHHNYTLKAPRKSRAIPRSMYESGGLESAVQPLRYVVFTAVIKGYDNLQPPRYRPPNCEFVAFSDQPTHLEGWTVVCINYEHTDPVRMARFIKLHPHLYFKDYEYSIWIDGNVGITGDIGRFFERLTPDLFMSAFAHPQRNCIYDEGVECILRRKDDPSVITLQLEKYRKADVPEEMGLWETNVIVRRHNDPLCVKLMAAWWLEVEIGSRRDQLSLPVVLRNSGKSLATLDHVGVSARRHPLITVSPHRGKRPQKERRADWLQFDRSMTDENIAITIGICVHNSLAEVKACLSSILSARSSCDTLIVVDDFSDNETSTYLTTIAAENDNVRLIRNATNLGYTLSANIILGSAVTDWVVLLNSDTIVTAKTFRKLISAAAPYPRLAVIGPLSNAASWQTVPRMLSSDGSFLINSLPNGVSPDYMDDLCERAASPSVWFVPLVNGFCLAIRRSVLMEIGLFDDQNFPVGYGEEDDLCLRVAEAGYVCGIAADTYVFHSKSASFTSQRRELLVASGKKALHRKYGADRLEMASKIMRNHPGLKRLRQRLHLLQHDISGLREGQADPKWTGST